MQRDPWHQEASRKVVEKLSTKFRVKAPFNLPKQNRPESLYQPDVCAFDRHSGELRFIVELQSKNVRKSIMGAAILAEICAKELDQRNKPRLIFVLKDINNREEIRKLKVRLDKMQEILEKNYLDKCIEITSLEELLKKNYL